MIQPKNRMTRYFAEIRGEIDEGCQEEELLALKTKVRTTLTEEEPDDTSPWFYLMAFVLGSLFILAGLGTPGHAGTFIAAAGGLMFAWGIYNGLKAIEDSNAAD